MKKKGDMRPGDMLLLSSRVFKMARVLLWISSNATEVEKEHIVGHIDVPEDPEVSFVAMLISDPDVKNMQNSAYNQVLVSSFCDGSIGWAPKHFFRTL